jgi:hypothetical protein
VEKEMEDEANSVDAEAADWPDLILLTFLYMLQGVPFGLSRSIILLLSSSLSYTQLGFLSIVGYPYSLKLLWSPIVDSVFVHWAGRRKSWIVPAQMFMAASFYYLGTSLIPTLLEDPAGNLTTFVAVFFCVILASATQDIAVDGWALEILPPSQRKYAASVQTIGLNCGFFVGYTVFLALNSVEFCTRFFGTDDVLFTLPGYFVAWSYAYFAINIYLIFFKKEDDAPIDGNAVHETYAAMWSVVRQPRFRTLAAYLLTSRLFSAFGDLGMIKVMEAGVPKDWLGLVAIGALPVAVAGSLLVTRLVEHGREFSSVYLRAYVYTLAASVAAIAALHRLTTSPHDDLLFWFCAYGGIGLFASLLSSAIFSTTSTFFARIADERIGGTYMTVLNSVSNFGGTWPAFFIFASADFFTTSHCLIPSADPDSPSPPPSFPCLYSDKSTFTSCAEQGGRCDTTRDGMYIVAGAAIAYSLAYFWFISRRYLPRLEATTADDWKVDLPARNADGSRVVEGEEEVGGGSSAKSTMGGRRRKSPQETV